jgi:cell wall-associated NlpC family hydrolase
MSFDPRLTPARADLAAAHLEGQVTADRFVEGTVHQVCVPVADLRRTPREDAGLDTQLIFGERFTVYEERGGWAWGQNGTDGYVGYVPAAALSAEFEDPTHQVAVLRTFLYPMPDLKTPPVGFLPYAAEVTVTDEDGKWRRVDGGGIESAWVFAAHLTELGTWAEDYVAEAERFLGIPYLWGGRSSFGLDCSALVQLALARSGIAVPRDTYVQAEGIGEDVPDAVHPDNERRELMRGDLIFWKGHIGIMTDPEHMLHANATHMAVTVDPVRAFAERIAPTDGPVTKVRRLG